jgi:hypothetical protein
MSIRIECCISQWVWIGNFTTTLAIVLHDPYVTKFNLVELHKSMKDNKTQAMSLACILFSKGYCLLEMSNLIYLEATEHVPSLFRLRFIDTLKLTYTIQN